jgi:hypothetical protein
MKTGQQPALQDQSLETSRRGERWYRRLVSKSDSLRRICPSCGGNRLMIAGTSIIASTGFAISRQCLSCGAMVLNCSSAEFEAEYYQFIHRMADAATSDGSDG